MLNAFVFPLVSLLHMALFAASGPACEPQEPAQPWLLQLLDESAARQVEPPVRAAVVIADHAMHPAAELTVTGLAPAQTVRIGVGAPNAEYELFTAELATAAGVVRRSFPLEPDIEPRSWVLVVADSAGEPLAFTAPFTIAGTGEEPGPATVAEGTASAVAIAPAS